MFRKVLPGGGACVGKQKIFATNGNDQSEDESINSPAFRRTNGKFTTKKNIEKCTQSQEKLLQARATKRSQFEYSTATNIALTRKQEVIEKMLFIYFTHIKNYNS